MKKLLIAICILITGISFWWAITSSQSDYHKIDNIDFSYATLILNSPNPERLSEFYRNALGAQRSKEEPVWSLDGSIKSVISLRTAGYDEQGPLLTILKSDKSNIESPLPNDLGYAHICFESDDIPGLIEQILKNGGKILSSFKDLEKVPAAYATDPDGNVFEIHLPFPTPVTPRTIYRSLNSLVRISFKLAPAKVDAIRFLHVNINSTDWIKTMNFYTKALGTSATGFERNYRGEFIENLTGINRAVVRGRHVELPGYSEGGPTFEIFTYNKSSSKKPRTMTEMGFVATGFQVQNLDTAIKKIISEGGTLVSRRGSQSAILKDIDGNILILAPKNKFLRINR